jgi:hypothetical protein
MPRSEIILVELFSANTASTISVPGDTVSPKRWYQGSRSSSALVTLLANDIRQLSFNRSQTRAHIMEIQPRSGGFFKKLGDGR